MDRRTALAAGAGMVALAISGGVAGTAMAEKRMSQSEKVKFVQATWLSFMKLDLDTALPHMTEDVVWEVPGGVPGVSGRNVGKQRMREIGQHAKTIYPNGTSHEYRAAYGDGDHVVLEWTVRAKVPKGDYENQYIGVFTLKGDKIAHIKLYYDTLIVNRLLG
jgi:ketosteroid isomerase-like protein